MLTSIVIAVAAMTPNDYVIAVPEGPYQKAADRLAEFHKAQIITVEPDLNAFFEAAAELKPQYVAFVLPPDWIDIDLTNSILSRASQVDDDPFIDFEYGFVTGRDGKAAMGVVERMIAAWEYDIGKSGGILGTWEGPQIPPPSELSTLGAMGFEATASYVKATEEEDTRRKLVKAALDDLAGRDVLLFYSHGYPDQMVGCFSAADLGEWGCDFTGSILFNCACYNGVPGRWYNIGPGGRFVDSGVIDPEQSVALEILDSGVTAYFAGINPWHAWLTNEAFAHVVDDGDTLGGAAKALFDRLALEFHPDPISFPKAADTVMTGEGFENRRRNGAGMILYGDPKFAPYGESASRIAFAEFDKKGALTIGYRPLVDGMPASDFMIAQSRLMNYYSVRKAETVMEDLAMEVYRVVELPQDHDPPKTVSVEKAVCGDTPVPTKAPQWMVETTPRGQLLHVRVPIDAPMFGSPWLMNLSQKGITIHLSLER